MNKQAAAEVLKTVFGFEAFRSGQEPVIEALLDGRNILAVMPTGSGKSLCFQIPALLMDGVTVVVSPLVALMRDQVAGLQLVGVAAETVNSSREAQDNARVWQQLRDGSVKLLYVSPERLMQPQALEALRDVNVAMLVVDEAHCISQWGAAFRPEYEQLSVLREVFPGRPIAAFTATADQITREDILGKLFAGEAESFVHGFDRPNIRLAVSAKANWKRQLLAILGDHKGESGIVYCLSRRKTEEVAGLLSAEGMRALAYHAGMSSEQRDENQNLFMAEPGVVMVATIAFGMGVDKPDVRFIVHTDLPGSIEAYYQEFGRAGRDGAPASAYLLYGLNDLRIRRNFIDEGQASEAHKRREHKRLDALMAYCDSPTCRRVALLRYFDEEIADCGNCDICLNPVDLIDGTVDGQKILSAVYRTGQRFGTSHIVDVLLGNGTEKTEKFRHDLIPTFGICAGRKRGELQALIRQLVAANFLLLDIKGYGGLKISEAGVGLLKGERTFRYRPDVLPRQAVVQKSSASATSDALQVELDENGQALLHKLKALRMRLAKERKVPAYVIFPDRTLFELAARRPTDRLAFSQVHGVGARKLERFADMFLAEINSPSEAA